MQFTQSPTGNLRLEMLQVARLAVNLLGESKENIASFLQSQRHADGGFCDRAGNPDLYYTVFGLDATIALREQPMHESVIAYLNRFDDFSALDFVHLASWARCQAAIDQPTHDLERNQRVAAQLERYRTPDGGYHADQGAQQGNAYGAFLAYGAYQDLGLPLPDAPRLIDSVNQLRTPDDAFSNHPGAPQGMTPATAAAVCVLHSQRQPLPAQVGEWLLQQHHPEGGFKATPNAPIPDLLSTATALHALERLQGSLEPIREPCLDFIDTLWSSQGGFYGHWADDQLDCEYAFYGLLALGHLSL